MSRALNVLSCAFTSLFSDSENTIDFSCSIMIATKPLEAKLTNTKFLSAGKLAAAGKVTIKSTVIKKAA